MSRWLNPTRRRNRVQAKIILITSVASAAAAATRGDGQVVRGGRWSLAHCSLLTRMETETNEERKAEIAIATEHRTMLAL